MAERPQLKQEQVFLDVNECLTIELLHHRSRNSKALSKTNIEIKHTRPNLKLNGTGLYTGLFSDLFSAGESLQF